MAPPQRGREAKHKRTGNARFDANDKRPRLRPGEFDLESARQEVFMLGIKGFTHKDKQEAKRDLAIRLGAIPKKAPGKNIKKHMEEVRERKEQIEKERQERQAYGRNDGPITSKKSFGQPVRKRGRKRADNEVPGMDFQIGKFNKKLGVQKLHKKDLQRLSKRK